MLDLKSIEIIEIEEADKFIDYLRLTQSHWGETSVNWYFRGHGDAEWLLQPAAWREDGRKILNPISRALKPGLKAKWEGIKRNIDKQWLIEEETTFQNILNNATELEAVYQFSNLADELGYPISPNDLISGLKYIVNFPGPFGWPIFQPKVEFFYAQHHGIPTRFLDWTRKSLIAAFFAAEEGIKLFDLEGNINAICVWAINDTFLNMSSFRIKHHLSIKTCPRHQHNFLHAQDGIFIYHEHADLYFIMNNRWPTFEDVIEESYDENYPKPLRKIILPIEKVGDLLTLLSRERITRAHLMPTYDSITKTLKSNWGLKDKAHDLIKELRNTREELAEFQCPYCQAPMTIHSYDYESREGYDIDHEIISYECGYTIVDGKDESPCKSINGNKSPNGTINVKVIE